MKSTLEVLSIFFISILFLFSTTNKKVIEIEDNKVDISIEEKQVFSKSIDYKATPIIIVKRD
jgi:hypothetical protein